jgi:hypothetical protein
MKRLFARRPPRTRWPLQLQPSPRPLRPPPPPGGWPGGDPEAARATAQPTVSLSEPPEQLEPAADRTSEGQRHRACGGAVLFPDGCQRPTLAVPAARQLHHAVAIGPTSDPAAAEGIGAPEAQLAQVARGSWSALPYRIARNRTKGSTRKGWTTMSTSQNPLTPQAAVNYWAQVSQHLAVIRSDLDRTVPQAPEGMRGMSEDAVMAMREAFDEALLAADAAMGMSSRLANAVVAPQPGRSQQQVRPQRTQQPYAHAGW